MNYRTARANWTPIDWGAFCKKTLIDANQQYRDQLLRGELEHQYEIVASATDPKIRSKAVDEIERLEKQLRATS